MPYTLLTTLLRSYAPETNLSVVQLCFLRRECHRALIGC